MSDQITWQAVLAAALLVVLAWSCRRDDRRLAFCLGLLLPVDYVTGVPTGVFDAARYAGVLWLLWRVRPTLSASANKTVVHLAAAIGTVAVVRGVFAIPRTDKNSMVFAGVMLVSTACAALLAQRVRVHGPVAMGYLAGVTLSAVVSIMQALHIPTLRAGNTESQRYPGVSTYTMLITWQLAFGLIMATYLAVTAPARSRRRYLALVAIAVLGLAMVTNGAQGGLIGIGAAVVVVAWINRHRLTWSSVGRYAAIGLVLVGAVAAVVAVAGVDIPTIDGIAGKGKGGYRNETARWDVAVEGMRELRRHPLLGMGRTNFMDKYTIAPHFLPIDSGVTAGVLGFVVASYLLFHLLRLLLQGPSDRRPVTVTGFAMLAAMSANTLTESYGPFIGLSRVSVLFLAVVAVKGQLAADRDPQAAAGEAPVPERDADTDARWVPGARLGRFARLRATAGG